MFNSTLIVKVSHYTGQCIIYTAYTEHCLFGHQMHDIEHIISKNLNDTHTLREQLSVACSLIYSPFSIYYRTQCEKNPKICN